MSTTMATPATGAASVHETHTRLGPIVVATDGTSSSDAAVQAAVQLAERASAPIHVLTVLEPALIVAADYGVLLPLEAEEVRQKALEQQVRTQIRQIAGPSAAWTVDLQEGDPVSVITRTARDLDARLIVMGIGHHNILDRLFGQETVLRTLRTTRSPVFAVPQTFQHLPSRIAIATDFSQASLDAGRAALALLPGLTMVYLAHAAPRLELQPEAYAAWLGEYGNGVAPAFERMLSELAVPAGVVVETITLTGKASRALLDFAKSAHLDALVTGSRGARLIERLLVGSTATALVRGAQCSVLAVPAALGSEREHGSTPETHVPREDWAHQLEEFTRRNAGRAASLEVDDPEIGAQAQHRGYPFLGAAYDHHDGRIEIMLGEQNSTRHLTRGISDVRSLSLLRDKEGRDSVLRVAHGEGQTILTLVR
ncbi:MAG: universal stress protein [Gemmatimonadaceae bacterium]